MFGDDDRQVGEHAWALMGDDSGRYPSGNSVLIRGSDATVVIDPSLRIAERPDPPGPVDAVLLTHVHEDHVAGLHRLPDADVYVHAADLLGVTSLDGLMTIYGLPPDADAALRRVIVDRFHYVARPDARPFDAGFRLDLGGVSVEAVHLPGHTRGHCGYLIEPDGVLVTGDIDLTNFGPYYGDVWSDLDDFVDSLDRIAAIEARTYVTYHQRGVVEGSARFQELVRGYAEMIDGREQRMVEFATDEPRTLADFTRHRFVYRPHVELLWVDHAEHRSAEQSLRRLVAAGRMVEESPGAYRAS